jgi:hypothetical protein
MKPPQWLAEKFAEQGTRVLHGKRPRADADAEIVAAVREHPEFGEQLGIATALRLFGKWVRKNASSGDLFLAEPFPGLPASMLINPKKAVPVAEMTAEDLDKAKHMLYTRTGNQVSGAKKSAEQERKAFDAFYDKIRPLLAGDRTVTDALADLAAKAA